MPLIHRTASTWYRLFLVLALVAVFSAQKLIEVRTAFRVPGIIEFGNSGRTKLALGVCISLLFAAVLIEFATEAVGGRVGRLLRTITGLPPAVCTYARVRFVYFLVVGLFLFAGLYTEPLVGYIAVTSSPPLGVAVAWSAAWIAFAVASSRARPGSPLEPIGFIFLILLSRSYAYIYHPMNHLEGDMLGNIDRCLDLLLQNRFPYNDHPGPVMPYWPVTFLPCALPKILGWDLRVVNLLIEACTIYAVFYYFGIGARVDASKTITARMTLPLIMLFPSWTCYSAETQYPVSILLAVLFCRAITCAGGLSQALILGIAVAANQTFGVFGCFVLPFWFKRFGYWAALRLAILALATCFLIIFPFVLWDAKEFFRVSLFALRPFGFEEIAGRFSLRPLVQSLSPHASAVLIGLVIVCVMVLNWIHSASAARVAATTALGYCIALLLLHRTFSHYFLPVIGMILVIPFQGFTRDREAGAAHAPDLGDPLADGLLL